MSQAKGKFQAWSQPKLPSRWHCTLHDLRQWYWINPWWQTDPHMSQFPTNAAESGGTTKTQPQEITSTKIFHSHETTIDTPNCKNELEPAWARHASYCRVLSSHRRESRPSASCNDEPTSMIGAFLFTLHRHDVGSWIRWIECKHSEDQHTVENRKTHTPSQHC